MSSSNGNLFQCEGFITIVMAHILFEISPVPVAMPHVERNKHHLDCIKNLKSVLSYCVVYANILEIIGVLATLLSYTYTVLAAVVLAHVVNMPDRWPSCRVQMSWCQKVE